MSGRRPTLVPVAKRSVPAPEVPEVTRVTVKGDVYVSAKEAASIAGVERDTFTSYVSRGQAPAPSFRIGTIKFWRLKTLREWMRKRPGEGARTDLRGKP